MLDYPVHLVALSMDLEDPSVVDDICDWLEEFMAHRFVLITGIDSGLRMSRSDDSTELNTDQLWAFENIQDALLFKLTWGGI